ncbi:hypothetical protein F5148DRAFT_1169234 [Russula earlei]|uniref:Uncharacterized protein n=1 Tax=Russula earlei TaxID=71964 RepID=A0ACC0ULC4_9AGAM|nr:hypothetical protein F5148DRAFT_1169234 [Russula earlei]
MTSKGECAREKERKEDRKEDAAGDERRRQVLCAHGCRDLGAYAVIQTPFHYMEQWAMLRTVQTRKALMKLVRSAQGRQISRIVGSTGANKTMGMYRKCSYSRIVSVCRTSESTAIVSMCGGACSLICDFERIVNHVRPESEFLYPIHHRNVVV